MLRVFLVKRLNAVGILEGRLYFFLLLQVLAQVLQ